MKSDTFREVFGPNLRKLRKLRGVSQFQLSVESGIPQGYISRIECGYQNDIYLTNALVLAQALDTTIENLMAKDAVTDGENENA